MRTQIDCLIVGGGVVGLSIAYALAQKGREAVLLERGRVGREASWAGAGILPPPLVRDIHDPLDQLRTLSHQLHASWAKALHDQTGIDNGFRRCGGLYLATTPGEAAALIGMRNYLTEHGAEALAVPLDSVPELEPALESTVASGRLKAAVECPSEAQLRNPRHLQALRSACESLGVELYEGVAAQSIQRSAKATRVITNSGEFTAQHVCLASGAWSCELMKNAGLANGVFPVKGQMLLFACEQKPFQRILNEGSRYLVARDDGYVLAGSTEEEVGFDKSTSDSGISSLQAFAERLVPELTPERRLRAWAGLRPASFDSFPYIGIVEGPGNLYVASGHFRSGLHLSTGTAHLISQLICEEEPQIDLTRFSPSRG